MLDLFDKKEDSAAATEGFAVEHVFDLRTDRWIVQIVPSPMAFDPRCPHVEATAARVVLLARQGHPLAIKALRLVMNSQAFKTKGER